MEELLEAAKTVCLNFNNLSIEGQIEVLKRIEPDFIPEEYFYHMECLDRLNFGADETTWGAYVKYYLIH